MGSELAKSSAGRRYEAIARIYCWKKKYRVIRRNWRRGRDEIDLVVEDLSGSAIALEVRGGPRENFFPPSSSPSAKGVV